MSDTDCDPAHRTETPRSLPDLESLRERADVPFDEETRICENRDHLAVDGQAAVGVTNDEGQHLLLVNRDLSIALLPHGAVEPGDDWAAAARRGVEGQTGISIALDGVEAVRVVDHVLEGKRRPHARTHRVVFRGSPIGGEIQPCKRSPAAGSDRWVADWFDGLPDGVAPPDDGAEADLRLFVSPDS